MIDQKAREIAEKHYPYPSNSEVEAARLGIIEGLEMALKIAVKNDSMEGHGAVIAEAICARIEESKG